MNKSKANNQDTCIICKPVELRIETDSAKQTEQKTNQSKSSGAVIVDVVPTSTPCDLASITFRNFYTAFLTIKVKHKAGGKESKWKVCLHQFELMPDPHCETGSQDYIKISANQMKFPPKKVTAVRCILQQPSPLWISFGIEEVALIPINSETPHLPVAEWLRAHEESIADDDSQPPQQVSAVSVSEVSEGLQRMWGFTETMRLQQQTRSFLGRYDGQDFGSIFANIWTCRIPQLKMNCYAAIDNWMSVLPEPTYFNILNLLVAVGGCSRQWVGKIRSIEGNTK